jgi:hypothetical protein
MRNDGTYFIVWQSLGRVKYYPPEVYPFDWQGIELFVHRVMDGIEKGEIMLSANYWQVSEKSTGRSLSIRNAMTIQDAKVQAMELLDKIGVDKFQGIIAKAKADA